MPMKDTWEGGEMDREQLLRLTAEMRRVLDALSEVAVLAHEVLDEIEMASGVLRSDGGRVDEPRANHRKRPGSDPAARAFCRKTTLVDWSMLRRRTGQPF